MMNNITYYEFNSVILKFQEAKKEYNKYYDKVIENLSFIYKTINDYYKTCGEEEYLDYDDWYIGECKVKSFVVQGSEIKSYVVFRESLCSCCYDEEYCGRFTSLPIEVVFDLEKFDMWVEEEYKRGLGLS